MTIKKSIHVKRPVETAFRVFTEDIGKWWPLKEGYSFGGDRADQIFLEGRTGGRFFERFTDGEEYVVGVVTTYSPPSRIVFELEAARLGRPDRGGGALHRPRAPARSSSSSTAAGMRRAPRPSGWPRSTTAAGTRCCRATLPPDVRHRTP